MRTPGKSSALNGRGDITQLTLDVCSTASVDAAVGLAIEAAGTLDVVVNNAGIELLGPVHLATDEEVQRQFDTNVTGVVRVARAVVPHMTANGGGVIVNVGSLAGLVGTPYSGLYAATKHAVEGISESMHFELSQHGIRVRVVEPGQFATSLNANSFMTEAMAPGSDEHSRWQRFHAAMRGMVNGQPADPQQVVDAIYAAATEVPGKLRYPVGADAELVIGTKSAMSFEDFDATMRAALHWYD